jgi:hypothetical protein
MQPEPSFRQRRRLTGSHFLSGGKGLVLLLCLARCFGLPARAEDSSKAARAALKKALPLIEQSAEFALRERACFTCHHGGHAAMAINAAWSRGWKINQRNLEDQLERAYRELANDVPRFKAGYSVSQTADGPGIALWMLDIHGWKANSVAAAAVDFFLQENAELDHWEAPMNRLPTLGSPFTTTFLVLRALQQHGTPAQRERIDRRTEAARKWLAATAGADNEDRVYRVRALHLLADAPALRTAVEQLLGAQRADGGWAQAAHLESDAYATSTALAALSDTGALNAKDAAFSKGIGFLLAAQRPDGSWFVRKRTHAVQPFFHAAFPHGPDQFIAYSATCWSAYVLAKTLPVISSARTDKYLASRAAAQARLH